MGYHVESETSFEELPERILVRKDGWLGAWRFYGEDWTDYWYIPADECSAIKPNNSDFDWMCSKCGEQWSQASEPKACPNCGAVVLNLAGRDWD